MKRLRSRGRMADRTLYLTAQDGMNLVGTVLEAKRPRAVLVWLHGFAEHRRRYQHFGRWLVNERITVAAIDLRGHGDSGGRRGYVAHFQEYYYDVAAVLHRIRKDYPRSKVILGSHSNGCLIAARYMEEGKSPFPLSGLIMTCPFLGLGTPVPLWKHRFASIASRFLPVLAVPAGLDPHHLSHDERIVLGYKNDPKVFKIATARWFTETLREQELAVSRAQFITLPTLVMQGMADPIVNIDTSRYFFSEIGARKKVWIPYEGMYHEILNEIDREKVYKDILRWIKKNI